MDMREQERIRDDRLRWHCRRALLELDIVLARFWSAQGDAPLSEREARGLTQLLALEDHPLWELVGSQGEAAGLDTDAVALLQRLRSL